MTIDVTIHQWEDATIQVTCYDQNGNIKDLSGGSVAFRMGDLRANSFTFATTGALVTDGSDGKIKVDLTAGQTSAIDDGVYDYQFIVTDADSNTQVVREGEMRVKPLLPAS